jgi:HEAT repeat protein
MSKAGWIPVALAAAFAGRAAAQESGPVMLELAAGQSWSVSYEAGGTAALNLGAPGDAAANRVELPAPAPGADATVTAETLTGGRDKRLGRVKLASPDGRTYEALVALTGTPAAPALVWSGWTGLSGDAGERVGWRIDVGDVDGNGTVDVAVGRLAETTRICGQTELPLLHRRAYDWASATLRPISAPRAGLDAEGATVLQPVARDAAPYTCSEGRCGPPVTAASALPAPIVVLPLLEYRSASSSYGDGGDPMRGAPPTGLEDMDGRSGWAEGVGGTGRLEFVTARIVTDAAPAHWLAVRVADDRDATAAKTRGRPKGLLVIDGAGHRWKLTPADDAAARGGAVEWYVLPEAPGGGCVTVALLDAWPATTAEGRQANVTWISDLQAFAELDPSLDQPLMRTILDDDSSAVAADRLLRAIGGQLMPVETDLAPTLGATGAGRLAAYLAARPDDRAAAALGGLLGSADASVARSAREAIVRRGEDATAPLLPLLHGSAPAVRQAVLELLGTIGGSAALPELLALVLNAGPEERAALRGTLAEFLGRNPGYADEVVAMAQEAATSGRPDAVIDLLRVTPLAEPEIRAQVGLLVVQALEAATTFEQRYHLLRRAGDLLAMGEPSPAEALLRAATTAAEPELREEAAQALADAPTTLDLTPLLDDPWPGVRAAAAFAVGRRGVEAEILALAERFGAEPWPIVRAEAADAFLQGEGWRGDDVALRLLADPSRDVRERAIRALDERGDEPALRMLAAVVETHTERLELRQQALAAVTRRCWTELKPLVVRVVEWSVRGDARRGDQALALDAIRALGTAGPQGIRSLLEEIVREAPVPPMLAAALQALGDLGETDAAAVIEPYLRHAEASVADAAQAALRALERGRAAARCGEVP